MSGPRNGAQGVQPLPDLFVVGLPGLPEQAGEQPLHGDARELEILRGEELPHDRARTRKDVRREAKVITREGRARQIINHRGIDKAAA
jgi:hypothetical protein